MGIMIIKKLDYYTNSDTVSTYVTAVPRSLGNKDSKLSANRFVSEVREDVVDENSATWSSSTGWMPPSIATGVFKVDSLNSSIYMYKMILHNRSHKHVSSSIKSQYR